MTNIIKFPKISQIKLEQGYSVLLGGKVFMASIDINNDEVLTLKEPSLKRVADGAFYDFTNVKKVKQFPINANVSNSIDSWLTKLLQGSLNNKGTIYLISDGVNTKIGATTYAVTKRLNELQTGNANKLSIVGSYVVDQKLTTEAFLHDKYKSKNVLGEWFFLSPSDINEILTSQKTVSQQFAYTSITHEESLALQRIINLILSDFKKIKVKQMERFSNAIKEFQIDLYYNATTKERTELKSLLTTKLTSRAA